MHPSGILSSVEWQILTKASEKTYHFHLQESRNPRRTKLPPYAV
jgi:hypothetical protein